MNQTPLTNMKGRWVHSTKEAFDALVGMGYMNMSPYNKKMEILEVYSSDNGASDLYSTCQVLSSEYTNEDSKQAYYHDGYFYDEPYEESTITEDKVPFPELEDIYELFPPEWLKLLVEDARPAHLKRSWNWKAYKLAYENGVDVKWKLKQKIDRRLHKNRPLALAIGKMLDEMGYQGIIFLGGDLYLERVSTTGKYFLIEHIGDMYLSEHDEVTLPDDYIIPDQVLQWMKEYEKEQ